MNNISLDISGKLPKGLVELYQKISEQAEQLDIQFLVVGATARDIVLVHGFDAAIERGTRDIDFGIQVQTWQQFEQLKSRLLDCGFSPTKGKPHQLFIEDSDGLPWEIDIIPFGEVSSDQHSITWPPENVVEMSVLGFEEALADSMQVMVSANSNLSLSVASPAGMLLLKLISWSEREDSIRKKDAADIFYLTKHYSKIPQIFNALYDEDYMELSDYQEHHASTMKLSQDARVIASPMTLEAIKNQLFEDESQIDKLVLDISRTMHVTYDSAFEIIEIIKNRLCK